VKYRHEMVISVLEDDISYSYSTIHKLNQWFDKTLLNPTIKVTIISFLFLKSHKKTRMLDKDNDGKKDNFEFEITFDANADKIKDIQFFIFFDYGLSVMNFVWV